MEKFLNGRLVVTTGDITGMDVDAVVNAANSSLMGGGGVDGAIHRAGGNLILDECRKIRETSYPEGLPAGEAVITTGGRLRASYVIHTVGPVWHGGNRGEEKLLYNAYYNSLALAGEKGIKSIAFPAVSTGVYGYPKDKAALTSFMAVKDFIKKHTLPEKIYFVFYSPAGKEIFLSSVKNLNEV